MSVSIDSSVGEDRPVYKRRLRPLLFATLTCGFIAVSSYAASASAQGAVNPVRDPVTDASVDDFVRALKPPARTRGLGRNLKIEPARIDVTVNFDFDSAQLKPDSLPQLERLAAAMRSDALTPLMFRIEGHTDAKGSARYNETLSERRAQAVVDFLARQGVAAERLKSAGMGFADLLDPSDPLSARNRRVRVLTLD